MTEPGHNIGDKTWFEKRFFQDPVMPMQIEPEEYQAIASEIESTDSPVGIDAKRTHVFIIHLLREIQDRLSEIERRISQLETSS